MGVALAVAVERLRDLWWCSTVASNTSPSSDRPAATCASRWSRTASQAFSTAPPDIIVWRLAEVDPAEPIDVSAGATSTSCTPRTVRAICCASVTNPWPTSAAAQVTVASPSSSRQRAVEPSM